MFRLHGVKLDDCLRHGLGSGAELIVVEGDSASKSVCRVRNAESQAVLPMQGKPMNAIKASKNAVERNELLRVLIDSIGADWGDRFDLSSLRYDRVILLFDPDADEFQGQRYRGLASMSAATLLATCIDPATRNISELSCADADAATGVFMGAAK